MSHPTRVLVHLDRIERNLALLAELVGGRPLWPCVKANAYGHGAVPVARHLARRGYDTLCVAHPGEALELREAGIRGRLVVLSATLPDAAEAVVAHACEPVVCTEATLEAIARVAARAGREVPVHLKVDTGMGRIGIRPDEVKGFLARAASLEGVTVRGLMSHFPRADEADKDYSRRQAAAFLALCDQHRDAGIEVRHLANSAAILDLPESHLDAARPGIAVYGIAPSPHIENPRVAELEPVLEWKTRITFLKEVPAGAGLSYGHTFHASRESRIAALPVGYGDGLHRGLSNRMCVLVGGVRCPQVGTITMDQILVDVTELAGRVALGDEAVLIGHQGNETPTGGETLTADELARASGTIPYEIVTAIARRVPREIVSPD